MKLKVWVDQDTCIGCDLCTSICPSVFVMKDDGKSESKDLHHPDAGTSECKEAKESCPVAAIKIEETSEA